MAVTESPEPRTVAEIVSRFLSERDGARGAATYEWLVRSLTVVPGASNVALLTEVASGVLTTCNGAAILHSLVGNDADRAAIIAHAKSMCADLVLRGLALPGDRSTKNLFEEARMPAQVLLH